MARLAIAEYFTGHWDEAAVHAEQGLAMAVDSDDHALLSLARWAITLVPGARGDWDVVQMHALAATEEAGSTELFQLYAALAVAHIASSRGRPQEVFDALSPLARSEPRAAIDEPGVWPWQHIYAEALVMLDRLDEAETFLPPHEELAANRSHRSMMARLACARGQLEAARGNGERADSAFRAAHEGIQLVHMPYERALIGLRYAQFLRRNRRGQFAAEPLEEVRRILQQLNARPALDACDRELASGVTFSTRTTRGPSGLTGMERATATLIVAGMTNREIAAELSLSIKTVEAYVTRAYVKLGVQSRAQLRAKARAGEVQFALEKPADAPR